MRGPAEALTPAAGAVLRPVRSPWALAWDQFRRHRPAMAGLVVLALLVAVTLVGSQTYPRRIDEIDFGRAMAPPPTQFPMGTDDLGRDILARVLWGGRISLAVGLAAMVIAVVLGTAVGAVSGFFGGIADGLLMRVTDLFISMPQLPLLLLLIYLFRDPLRARFGPEVGIFFLIVGVIGGFNWMSTARLVRAAFLSVKQKEFIEAARCIGAPTHRLILAHILPNVLSPVIVAATLGVGQAIIAESALSFLGLGFPPDIPTWGRMLFDAKDFLDFAPHMALFPGLMIFTTVLAINYVGDGLRDALVQVIDQYTVKLIFEDVTPGWYVPFFGTAGRVIPKHIFQQYKGKGAGQAPPNNRPVGTGPYKVVDFRPGDVVVYEINEYYREPDKPFFKRVELKGGGDAPSAARAALQTGEVDYAWNLQVEPQILDQLQQGGKGVVIIIPAGNVERILVNFTDPRKEVDGERSSLKAPHPWQTDLKVRQAYALLCNRKAVVDQLYPKGFEVAANLLVEPKTFRSPNTTWEFNVEKANRLLDEAGWTRGPDGVRQKGGVKMEVLYQTTVNAVRQKTQEIIKQAFEQAGIKMEIKAVQAAVFFSSDPANPDTAAKFYADLEMFTNGNDLPDPQAYMASWVSWQIAQKANEWRGNNYTRWSNPRYDDLYRQAQRELDARRRAQLFIEMNDLVVNNVVEIPLVHRKGVSGASRTLKGIKPTAWDSELWDIADWYREA